MFQKLKIDNGRVFVVGDIHGCFTLLVTQLDELGFDYEKDTLLSVGDLVDRGPESYRAVDFLGSSWFHAIRGNHEQMVIDAGGTSWHYNNGGEWFTELSELEKAITISAFKKLPLIMEVELPNGRRIGLCHASFPPDYAGVCDWNNAQKEADRGEWLGGGDNEILWDRYQIGRAKKALVTGEKGKPFLEEFNIKNIDHVYFGHTPLKVPLDAGNCSWIDTGAFATDNLTILQVA